VERQPGPQAWLVRSPTTSVLQLRRSAGGDDVGAIGNRTSRPAESLPPELLELVGDATGSG